ncbi:MAG: hypothetical protein VKK62_10690 [Synechococcaceae cyanobacterium]|nr:hypothetical protein [Synechococcaceae cyanobacterium]
MFGSWSHNCSNCANYSGSPHSCGYCRVWSAVVLADSGRTHQCPHWISRELERPSATAASC